MYSTMRQTLSPAAKLGVGAYDLPCLSPTPGRECSKQYSFISTHTNPLQKNGRQSPSPGDPTDLERLTRFTGPAMERSSPLELALNKAPALALLDSA